jgi:predicted transcriptional regulator
MNEKYILTKEEIDRIRLNTEWTADSPISQQYHDMKQASKATVNKVLAELAQGDLREEIEKWITDYKDAAERHALAENPNESADYLFIMIQAHEAAAVEQSRREERERCVGFLDRNVVNGDDVQDGSKVMIIDKDSYRQFRQSLKDDSQ